MIVSIVISVISVLIIVWMMSNKEFINRWERGGDYNLDHPHSLIILVGFAWFPVVNVVVLIILINLIRKYHE